MPTTWKADPTGYSHADGSGRVATIDPIGRLYQIMGPLDTCELGAGDYRRTHLGPPPANRPVGSWQILFRGPPKSSGGIARFVRDDSVSGTQTLRIVDKAGHLGGCDVKFSRITIDCDDLAGVFTEKGGSKNITFFNCDIVGRGSAFDPNWATVPKTKWGCRVYDIENWIFDSCRMGHIFEEHAFYGECHHGPIQFINCSVEHCGRTAYQFVSRPPADGTYPATGDITISGGSITDVCLGPQGGGSAIHLAPGMPNTTLRIGGLKVSLGNDERLAAPFHDNITGAIAIARPGAGSGSVTDPGNLKACYLDDGFSSIVGKRWPGAFNGSKRSNVNIADTDLLVIGSIYLEQGPQAHPIALEIAKTVAETQVVGTPEIRGQIKYWGATYATVALWKAAHPECF